MKVKDDRNTERLGDNENKIDAKKGKQGRQKERKGERIG